ncbi:MAG: EamA family transporter [Lachnospiraceae bacterium]|nr:EamA family transporter [Lachnospiraceae bacterium]
MFFVILAAALYALNSPFSKLLLSGLSPTMLAALLYLGAGIGLFFVGVIKRKIGIAELENRSPKKNCPQLPFPPRFSL